MQLRRLLRPLILAEVALVVIFIVVELIAERFLPAPLREWAEAQVDAFGPLEIAAVIIALPLLAALVVSWIGLWRLWRPARWIYLAVTLGGLLLEVMMGPTVISGPGAALSTLQSMITGLIVALVYLTPLSEEFERPSAAPPGGAFEVNMPAPDHDPGGSP